MINFLCFVLWRNRCIPEKAPNPPNKKAVINNVLSLMRVPSPFDLYLSRPYRTNTNKFHMTKIDK